MNVSITEKETGRLVGTYTVLKAIGSSNYDNSEEDWYSEAWRCAVVDKAVFADQRDKYSFHIVEET